MLQTVIKSNKRRALMEKSHKLLDKLTGSLSLPKKYNDKSIDSIIKDSKKEYFRTINLLR